MHEPMSSFDLVSDEIEQREQTGYAVQDAVAALAGTDPSDDTRLEAIYAELIAAPRTGPWDYEEPDDLAGILETLPSVSMSAVPDDSLDDKLLGAWLGRIAGCNLGKPVEWGPHWTVEHIRSYLERADAYPLRDYFPLLSPMPDGYDLRENWPETTRGNVDGGSRDDDVDYPILGLHLLETHGAQITPAVVGEAWLTLFPYRQIFTAERAAYLNLLHGVPAERAAITRNPYREWIGALIRGDAFGWVSPGQPRAAMQLAYQDAALSHVANGIYGELWSAALLAGAFTASTVAEAFEQSLDHVPPRSRLAETLQDVAGMRRAGLTWDAALERIRGRYSHYSWVHTIPNAAIIAAGLLWGGDDYSATVGLTVMGGWDTDSNAATTGSVAGVVLGARRLPAHFVEPLHDTTRSALFGFDNSRISDLARRTAALARAGITSPASVT
ncbi:MAG: ADP-ribosylglycohydrolase family protein [Pseudolysinimonas sp.]